MVLTPMMPGWLTATEAARLAGVNVRSFRFYVATKKVRVPQPSARSGASPIWKIQAILDWLSNRPISPVDVEVRPNGDLVVISRGRQVAYSDSSQNPAADASSGTDDSTGADSSGA